MTAQEFELLKVLIQNKNLALSREKLLESAWGYDYYGDTRTVDMHIQRLRKKLSWDDIIVTVYKYGYRLEISFVKGKNICIPAVISCLVIAAFLIEKNLDENIDAETQIAIKNVEKIENRIKYNVNSTILFKSAEKSNTEKNVKIYYYNNNQLEYETSEVLQSYADEFKTTENNKYIAQQKEINDKNYIFVSTKMGEDKTIVYTYGL